MGTDNTGNIMGCSQDTIDDLRMPLNQTRPPPPLNFNSFREVNGAMMTLMYIVLIHLEQAGYPSPLSNQVLGYLVINLINVEMVGASWRSETVPISDYRVRSSDYGDCNICSSSNSNILPNTNNCHTFLN